MLWHARELTLPKIGCPKETDKTDSSWSLCPSILLCCATSPWKRKLPFKLWLREVWGLFTLQEVEGTDGTTPYPWEHLVLLVRCAALCPGAASESGRDLLMHSKHTKAGSGWREQHWAAMLIPAAGGPWSSVLDSGRGNQGYCSWWQLSKLPQCRSALSTYRSHSQAATLILKQTPNPEHSAQVMQSLGLQDQINRIAGWKAASEFRSKFWSSPMLGKIWYKILCRAFFSSSPVIPPPPKSRPSICMDSGVMFTKKNPYWQCHRPARILCL